MTRAILERDTMPEDAIDSHVRLQRLSEFVGQTKAKENLRVFIEAAKGRGEALVNLGYGQSQAGAAVATAMRKHGDDQPTEKLIRQALKELALG
jgi:Holliday junction resolvasome RuvABC ATP-dependent DNA helicase subunit